MTTSAPARSRRRLWPLAIPAVLYCLAPLVANRIEPRILGIPFLIAYVLAVTIVSPIVIWAVAHRDPLYRADAPEPVPADEVLTGLVAETPVTEEPGEPGADR